MQAYNERIGNCRGAAQNVREFDKKPVALYIRKNGDACKRATASVARIDPPRVGSYRAGFFMLLSPI